LDCHSPWVCQSQTDTLVLGPFSSYPTSHYSSLPFSSTSFEAVDTVEELGPFQIVLCFCFVS